MSDERERIEERRAPRTPKNKVLRVIRALLMPPGCVVALAVPVICALMVWVFLFDNKGNPLSYVAYAVSAYLFTILVIWVVRDVPAQRAIAFARRNPHVSRLMDDEDMRRRLFVFIGVVVDVLWALGNLVLGIAWLSVWFITLGIYCLVFGLMRGALLYELRKSAACTTSEQARVSRICGIMLIASVLVLSGIVTLIMIGEGSIRYDKITVIAVATFTFFSLISSIVGLVRLRSHENLLVGTNCRVNLAIALVSLFTLEIGMFSAYATADDADLVFVMPIITGAAIASVLCIMGVITVCLANRTLADQDSECD